jgi:hypothetical protein
MDAQSWVPAAAQKDLNARSPFFVTSLFLYTISSPPKTAAPSPQRWGWLRKGRTVFRREDRCCASSIFRRRGRRSYIHFRFLSVALLDGVVRRHREQRRRRFGPLNIR